MNIRERIIQEISVARKNGSKPIAIDIGYLAAAELHRSIEDERKTMQELLVISASELTTIVGSKFCTLPLQLCGTLNPNEVRIVFDGWDFKVGDVVTITTETVYDFEGVPVSIPTNTQGRVVEIGERMAQIDANWGHGREVVGVPLEKIG